MVASEVKQPAARRAKAMEEIGARITGVQGATDRAVQSIISMDRVSADQPRIWRKLSGAAAVDRAVLQYSANHRPWVGAERPSTRHPGIWKAR